MLFRCSFRYYCILLFFLTLFYITCPILGETNDTQYNDAKSLYLSGDYNASLILWEKILTSDPKNYKAWNNRGLVLIELHKYKEAIDSLNHALQYESGNADIWYNLGLSHFSLSRFSEAEDSFNHSIQINPDYRDAWFKIGILRFGKGDYQSAINSFNKSIQLRSDDPQAWLNLGFAYEQQEQFAQAVKAYDQSVLLDPQYSQGWYNRGRIYNLYGNSTLASESFQNYTQLVPDDPHGWFLLAKAKSGEGLKNESIIAVEKAISLDPNNTEYVRYLKVYQKQDIYDTSPPIPILYGAIIIFIAILSFILFGKHEPK